MTQYRNTKVEDIDKLIAMNNNAVDKVMELEAEVERLRKQVIHWRAQDATSESHAARLAGALELFINADPTWASDGDGVMEVTWIAFAKARAALAAWKQAQGGDDNGDSTDANGDSTGYSTKAADNTG